MIGSRALPRILVLGAGFAGLWAAIGAARKIDQIGPAASEVEILVLHRNDYQSEKQAQRILDLLMRHANDIAVTLTQFPQYYEPLFLERDHKGRTVSIVDEWCCGYVKGIALDPSGWHPLFEAHPDWFEAIHLYGTERGWDRLKELVEAYQDADARHQAFVELIAPAARNVHAYWLARRAPARDTN